MSGNGARRYTGGMVNLDKGMISREIFTSQAVYDDELERVFARSWLFVGHESHIPEAGRLHAQPDGRRIGHLQP